MWIFESRWPSILIVFLLLARFGQSRLVSSLFRSDGQWRAQLARIPLLQFYGLWLTASVSTKYRISSWLQKKSANQRRKSAKRGKKSLKEKRINIRWRGLCDIGQTCTRFHTGKKDVHAFFFIFVCELHPTINWHRSILYKTPRFIASVGRRKRQENVILHAPMVSHNRLLSKHQNEIK